MTKGEVIMAARNILLRAGPVRNHKRAWVIALFFFITASPLFPQGDPVCAYCQKKISGEYVIVGDKKYHRFCYENFIIPKCAVCNLPISGSYFEDIYKNRFHSYHLNEFPKCDCCNRLICQSITKGGREYQDGRHICNICYATAIFDQHEIERLLEKVSGRLTALGLRFSMGNIKIIGMDRNNLRSKAKSYSEKPQGFCDSETHEKYIDDKMVKRSIYHTIYILTGVPSIIMESVIAHELMHAWIYDNTKNTLSDKVCEGSCNYASYLYLKTLYQNPDIDALKMLEADPDPVYGVGFREIRDRFENKALPEFLGFLKR